MKIVVLTDCSIYCMDIICTSLLSVTGVTRDLQYELDTEISYYITNTFAPTTKRTYATHRDSYLAFCNMMGYCAVPASTHTICRYAALLARSLSYNSVIQYMNIIRIMHLEAGFKNPLTDNFQLKCTLQGFRRTLGDPVSPKLPMTPAILRKIVTHLDLATSQDAGIWGAALLMFYGML